MIINGKLYEDIFQLAKEMYLDSDYFADELHREPLLSFIQSRDEKKYEKIQKLSLLSIPDDIFVFKASYILNPFMSLRFKGFCFEDYQQLGETMLSFSPTPSPVLTLLVRYGLLSEHMKMTYYEHDHPEDYAKMLSLEKLSETDLPYSYFMIGYFLSKRTTIYYKGLEYKDIFNLTYFLCKQEEDLEALGESLSKSPLLRAYSQYSKDNAAIENYLHLCRETDKSENLLRQYLKKRKRNDVVPNS